MSEILASQKVYKVNVSARVPISKRQEIDRLAESFGTKASPLIEYILTNVDLSMFDMRSDIPKIYVGIRQDNLNRLKSVCEKNAITPTNFLNKLLDDYFKTSE